MGDMGLELVLNGERVRVEGIEADSSLLDWLRASGRTGTKEGCGEGDCGACTVALLDTDAQGAPTWRSLCSCITPLPAVAGRQIVTVEGLADDTALPGAEPHRDALHPVQDALVEHHGSQCGFCTPGFAMAGFEAFHRADLDDQPQPGEIADQLSGNLCRCTGYRPIREALQDALTRRPERAGDRFHAALLNGSGPWEQLDFRAPSGRFLRPTTLDGLLEVLRDEPTARLVAGATELGVERNKQGRRFELLVSTDGVHELRACARTDEGWRLGGAATLTDLEEFLGDDLPELRKMVRVFASRPIRNRATVAGNLVNASPIGDLAPVLLALGAEVELRSVEGSRRVALHHFFTGYRQTVRRADEVLLAVHVPRPGAGERRADSYKVSKRRELDISIVAAAFAVELDGGVVTSARIDYGGVAATPLRAVKAEEALVGQTWDEATANAVAEVLSETFTPIDDVRASAAYRQQLIVGLWWKFFSGDSSEAQEGDLDFVPSPALSTPSGPGHDLHHDSAIAHVTGRARYIDDEHGAELCMWPLLAPHAHARLVSIDVAPALDLPGVLDVLWADTVPGHNDVGALRRDEPLFAEGEVLFHGQLVAAVVATSRDAARAGAAAIAVDYEELPALLDLGEAIAQGSFHDEPHIIRRGDCDAALAAAPHHLSGRLDIGGQEHLYLETHAAWAEADDSGGVHVSSSTQHPTEVQGVVARVLGLSNHRVTVVSPRMGGAFGGKETQGNGFAAAAALAALRTGRRVAWMLDRDVDMQVSGKRHPFRGDWEVGFDDEGTLLGLRVDLVADAGYAFDLSGSILDRGMYHLDASYYLPNVDFRGRAARTNRCSFTAFRGFGGPQGMLVTEDVISRVAAQLGLPPEQVRRHNLYRGEGETATAHFGMPLGEVRVGRMWDRLLVDADFATRREAIDRFNATASGVRRGLAITPAKFGISFTAGFLNQAGALVHVYKDGTVQVNHGGTEMGQGLYAKMQGVAVRELGLPPERVRVMKTRTDKVPNTSATAASSGADLNGAAVRNACLVLRETLSQVASELFWEDQEIEVSPTDVTFAGGELRAEGAAPLPFAQVAFQAWFRQRPLSATGYYQTPGLVYDRAAGRGRPFHYFTWGVGVTEVEIDLHTGAKRVLRADLLQDAGDSLNPAIDRGQVEGAYVQGVGWLTSEELKWDAAGRLLTHSASTYPIPTVSDAPSDLRVALLENATQDGVIHGSKAVGEPPFVLAMSAWEAIKDAVAASGPRKGPVDLEAPATHEAILKAVRSRQ